MGRRRGDSLDSLRLGLALHDRLLAHDRPAVEQRPCGTGRAAVTFCTEIKRTPVRRR